MRQCGQQSSGSVGPGGWRRLSHWSRQGCQARARGALAAQAALPPGRLPPPPNWCAQLACPLQPASRQAASPAAPLCCYAARQARLAAAAAAACPPCSAGCRPAAAGHPQRPCARARRSAAPCPAAGPLPRRCRCVARAPCPALGWRLHRRRCDWCPAGCWRRTRRRRGWRAGPGPGARLAGAAGRRRPRCRRGCCGAGMSRAGRRASTQSRTSPSGGTQHRHPPTL